MLAAAIHCNAQAIVTINLKHFPESALTPHALTAQHPDLFLGLLYGQYDNELMRIVVEQAAALKNPPLTPNQVLDTLAQHIPSFVERVRVRIQGS